MFKQSIKITKQKSTKSELMRYKRKTKQNRKKMEHTFMPKKRGCARERKKTKK